MNPNLSPCEGVKHTNELSELLRLGTFPLDRNLDVRHALPSDQFCFTRQGIGGSGQRQVYDNFNTQRRQRRNVALRKLTGRPEPVENLMSILSVHVCSNGNPS